MSSRLDLTNQRFGRLIVLEGTTKRKYGEVIWDCICDCGKFTKVRSGSLRSSKTKSCGCLHREQITELGLSSKGSNHGNYRHGGKGTRLYNTTWIGMKKRCYDKNNEAFSRYGGRGIVMCPEWVNDFITFRDWANRNGYDNTLTIDRIKNDGNYSPDNCQFITRSENSKKGFKHKNV